MQEPANLTFDEDIGQREILRLEYDGRIFWNGREVVSDEELREAVIKIANTIRSV